VGDYVTNGMSLESFLCDALKLTEDPIMQNDSKQVMRHGHLWCPWHGDMTIFNLAFCDGKKVPLGCKESWNYTTTEYN